MTAPEPVKHTLSPVAIDAGMVLVVCSCGQWSERWQEGPAAPGWLDVEAAHRAHAAAGNRKRLTPPQFPPGIAPGLDGLIAAAKAMAEHAQTAAAALQEFAEAHAAAQANGVGVLVTRRPDGTITSTPNVYLAPGTVIYADGPGPWTAPGAVEFIDARAPFEAATGWAPSYTTAPSTTPQDLPNAA
jgi:hypothetical protein